MRRGHRQIMLERIGHSPLQGPIRAQTLHRLEKQRVMAQHHLGPHGHGPMQNLSRGLKGHDQLIHLLMLRTDEQSNPIPGVRQLRRSLFFH